MARVRSVSSHAVERLTGGWELSELAAGAAAEPSQLDPAQPWMPAPVPGTLASALRQAGRLDPEHPPAPLDGGDVWYRRRLDLPVAEAGEEVVLCLEGLATFAEVWLDGELLLRSRDMFLRHEVDLTRFSGSQLLAIRFASTLAVLKEKRPRPRWKTRLTDQQQLRWVRTTLLGHIPGWCPPVPPVGPWREVRLERRRLVAVRSADLKARPHGEGGKVQVDVSLRALGAAPPRGALLSVGEKSGALSCERDPSGVVRVSGELTLDSAARWWPHTHGQPHLYPVRLDVDLGEGGRAELDLGSVGFREIAVDRSEGAFALSVNGVPVFCRGACWTPLDILSPGEGDPGPALDQARQAGMNMLRISGPFVEESDLFHEGCAERGILVWHDFLLANMDYPAGDSAFVELLRREAESLVSRIQSSPALAILCGGSEVEQQAAMMGLPPEDWSGPIFEEVLAGAAASLRPDVPYVRGSPSGGALPFHPDTGVAHYYGVGAYLRPLSDARSAGVRFTSETLGFSNVPEDSTVARVLGDGQAPVHHPAWKSRVPRDTGAGWDFEDVRDHYLKLLFGVDPVALRYSDPPRYLAMSRATSCEVMAATMAEWRRAGSSCRGGLVWFLRDLLPGAGWGVVDSFGLPKAAYHGLARSMQPLLLALTDEGLNGLQVQVVNDGPARLTGEVEVVLYRGELAVASGKAPVAAPAHGALRLSADAILGRFTDSTLAYRFGPPGHDLAVARLRDGSGNVLETALFFSLAEETARRMDPGLSATWRPLDGGDAEVTVKSRGLAISVSFDAPGYVASRAYFHLPPGGEATARLRALPGAKPLRGHVQALNASSPVRIDQFK